MTRAATMKARIPFDKATAERFGLTDAAWKTLVENVHPKAKNKASIAMVLSYCEAREIDPMERLINIVNVWDRASGQMVEAVLPSLAFHRVAATNSGAYAGMDQAQFGPDIITTLDGQPVTHPEWCQITLYRMVQGVRCAFPGPRILWMEYYSREEHRSAKPHHHWRDKPWYMLEKVAESLALRRAFPDHCPDPSAEEMVTVRGDDVEPRESLADRLKRGESDTPPQERPDADPAPAGGEGTDSGEEDET